VEQLPTKPPAAAERAKEAPRMGKAADQSFRPLDLRSRNARLGDHAERHTVRVCVIADPVAVRMSALRDMSPLAQFLADHEERRADVMAPQRIEDLRRYVRLRAIVEGERDQGHDGQAFTGISASPARDGRVRTRPTAASSLPCAAWPGWRSPAAPPASRSAS